MKVPNPGIFVMGQFSVESDFGLMRQITMAVHQEEHLAAIVGGVEVLHHKRIRRLDVEVVGQVINVH